MMKLSQSVYRESSTMRSGSQFAAATPQWISGMGLEWLHDLVLRAEELAKAKTPRQG